MKKLNVNYSVITGSQYNMVDMPAIRLDTPFAVPQTRKATKTGLKRKITTQNKTIPGTEHNKENYATIVVYQPKIKISQLVPNNSVVLKSSRKRCDKKRTVAIDKARIAKQTRQTMNLPEMFDPELPDLDIIKIKPAPIELHAKAYQHIVTMNHNEIAMICEMQR